MAYQAPRTWSAGERPTAAQFNQDIRDNVAFLANPPACRVTHDANQNLTSGTTAFLAFNTEIYDTDTMHDTSTNNTRITFTTAGLYVVGGNVRVDTASNFTKSELQVRKNGSAIIAIDNRFMGAAVTIIAHEISTVYKFAAADYVELGVTQTNASATVEVAAAVAEYSPIFSATWIGTG